MKLINALVVKLVDTKDLKSIVFYYLDNKINTSSSRVVGGRHRF